MIQIKRVTQELCVRMKAIVKGNAKLEALKVLNKFTTDLLAAVSSDTCLFHEFFGQWL
jgi:hypothetical protein